MTSSLPRRDNTRNSLDQRKRKRFLLAQKWERNVPTLGREPWKDWGCATTVFLFCFFFKLVSNGHFFVVTFFFHYTSDSKYLTNIWKQSKKSKELGWKALWDCRPSCRWWNLRRAWLELHEQKLGLQGGRHRHSCTSSLHMVQKPSENTRKIFALFKPGTL